MRIAWASDLHLNFVTARVGEEFCRRVNEAEAEALLIGGDIAESSGLETWLRLLQARVVSPIYFVLGNHDYYRGSIAGVRQAMQTLRLPGLHWLAESEALSLTSRCGLVGQGGWGDGRLGDIDRSPVILNDFQLIAELAATVDAQDLRAGFHLRSGLKAKLRQLGEEAARALAPSLRGAAARFEQVLVLTHVPPFREACWHEGKISSDDWLPHYTCHAMGELLSETAEAAAQTEFLVLCGHTHGGGEAQILDNLKVLTSPAEYGEPDFQVLEVG